MGPHQVNALLEATNGVWTVLNGFFIAFLIQHLVVEHRSQNLSPLNWLFNLPLGMQVAVSLLIATVGGFVLRASVWVWRIQTGGQGPISTELTIAVLCGTTIGAVGMLCQLRVFSQSYYGNWPWIIAALASVAFVLWTVH